MHTLELIAAALRYSPDGRAPLPEEPAPGVCAVTGSECETIARRHLLTASFTSQALLRAPTSDRVGVAAWWALRHRWERMSSWFCDPYQFARLDRQGVRVQVLTGWINIEPWAGYATTSYKKHGALLAPVNPPGRNVWCWETEIVDASDEEAVNEIWRRLNIELRRGFGRSILESLDCPAFVARKIGAREWMDFEAWARPRYRSSLYRFLCYLLPSQEELKVEAAA